MQVTVSITRVSRAQFLVFVGLLSFLLSLEQDPLAALVAFAPGLSRAARHVRHQDPGQTLAQALGSPWPHRLSRLSPKAATHTAPDACCAVHAPCGASAVVAAALCWQALLATKPLCHCPPSLLPSIQAC